nr:Crp/Fnr family transcriptional regulator [Aurantimonas sp. VKM B-3413]
MSEADKRVLSELCESRVRVFRPRENLILEGDRPQYINLFLDGWACRYKDLENGKRQILSLFIPGDLCDVNIFILKQMDHSIAAITPARVAEISRSAFEAVIADYPRVTQALWWETLVAVAIQREWTASLGQRDARERVCHLLCELFVRLRCVGLTAGNTCPLPLSQSEIGEATGLTTVSVNRVLQELRRSNLISLKGRILTVPDLEKLKAVAMFNANYLHLERDGDNLAANF